MTDAPLQAAAAPLRTDEIYQTFVSLCVDTEGTFETACASAAVRGFEPFDSDAPPRLEVARLLAEARFRKPGFFFTASTLLADAPGQRARRIRNCSLVARPASFKSLSAVFADDLRTPAATTPLPGVEYAFVGDPRETPAIGSRREADERYAKGEGELVLISVWEVREHPSRPGDAVAMSYQRWSL